MKVDQLAVDRPGQPHESGWDQQAADAVNAVAAGAGITPTVAENGGYGDITPILKDLGAERRGTDHLPRQRLPDGLSEFAAEANVPVAVIENPGAVTPMLVSDIETQAQEVAYLAGVLAGKVTQDRHRRRRRSGEHADLELHDRRLRRGPEGDES